MWLLFRAKVSKDNNLLMRFSGCKRMASNKNGDLSPKDFTYGSNHKAWWICYKGHSYQSAKKREHVKIS